MFFAKNKPETPNYGKIIAITTAAVAGTCAVAYFVYKLVAKLQENAVYEEDLCEGCPLADECDGECPVEELTEEEAEVLVEEEAVEAVEATEEAAE